MKYVVPAAPTDLKSQMVDVTDMPDILEAAAQPDSLIRLVEHEGRTYTYASAEEQHG